jgi:hypothetical protein
VLGLELSVFVAVLGEVDRRCGENASLSFPTGEAFLLMSCEAMLVLERLGAAASSAEVAESARFVSEVMVESMVSDAISGDDSVR